MTFKEQVAADIDNVFLNFDEFGEYHDVEGKQVLMIIDNDKLAELKMSQKEKSQILELVEADLLLYARTADLPKSLEPGNLINFDGKVMIIRYSNAAMGITELAIAQNKMY